MDKNTLIKETCKKTGFCVQDAKKCIETFLDTIKESLQNDEPVSLTGIGTLYYKQQEGRSSTNPQTGKGIYIPPKKVLKFNPSSKIKVKAED